VDLLDYYRGQISTRRMILLVVKDRARMPRLRTALAGHDPWEPIYGELEYGIAALNDQAQILSRKVHVAHGLKPKLGDFHPYPRPGDKPPKPVGPPKLTKQQRDYLEQFAPAA
jgi:hypothetical protein